MLVTHLKHPTILDLGWRVSDLLGVPPWQGELVAIGIFERLVALAIHFHDDGAVGRFTARQIAQGVNWQGDAAQLEQALVESAVLVPHDVHRLAIADFPIHAPQFIHRRLRRATRLFWDGTPPGRHGTERDEEDKPEVKSGQPKGSNPKPAPKDWTTKGKGEGREGREKGKGKGKADSAVGGDSRERGEVAPAADAASQPPSEVSGCGEHDEAKAIRKRKENSAIATCLSEIHGEYLDSMGKPMTPGDEKYVRDRTAPFLRKACDASDGDDEEGYPEEVWLLAEEFAKALKKEPNQPNPQKAINQAIEVVKKLPKDKGGQT